MTENFDQFGPEHHLVSTCFDYGGREFLVTVEEDGFSYWFDPIAKNAASKLNRNFVITAAIDNGSQQRKDLDRIYDEFTVKFLLPEAVFTVIRDELSPLYWQDEIPNEFEQRLDAILEPIFWEHVNPLLSPPIDEKFRPS